MLHNIVRNENDETYYKLPLITDFISGMTDFYAIDLYRKLIGIELP